MDSSTIDTTVSILLSWDSSGQWDFSLGAIGVLSACVLWGIVNVG